MKNASETMFKIGKVFNIIYIPVSIILFVAGLILIVQGSANYEAATTTKAQQEALIAITSGSTYLAYGIILFVGAVVSLIVCLKKHGEIENGNNEVSPRVFLIVFGAIGENVFYVLAGIFGLVARNQEQNQTKIEE